MSALRHVRSEKTDLPASLLLLPPPPSLTLFHLRFPALPLFRYSAYSSLLLSTPLYSSLLLFSSSHRYGYGHWERFKRLVRRADRFRFDYIFRSLTPQQLKARCEALMKCVEKENKELRQRKDDEARRSEKQVTSS